VETRSLASAAQERRGGLALTGLLISMRPEQWTKNLIVFAALLFGRRLFDPAAVGLSLAAFLIFCALSGVVYIFNDVVDQDADRQHPLKARRPIASGEPFWMKSVSGPSSKSQFGTVVAFEQIT
jgi:hypothetical protein